MNTSAALLLDVWEAVSESLPNSKREDMARKLIHIFADKGMDEDDFESIKGEDHYLDSAIEAQYTGEHDDPETDYDSMDYDDE